MAMGIVMDENLGPGIWLTTFGQIVGLYFERRIIVDNRDELVITETFSIGGVCKVKIACFAEFSNYQRLCARQGH